MILRVIFVMFASGASGICCLAGFARLLSGLLIGFGSLACIFFGVIFVVAEERRQLWLPVSGEGSAWPFFFLAFILAGIVGILFLRRGQQHADREALSSMHFQYLIGAFFAYILSVFLPALLWFPSEAQRRLLEPEKMVIYVFLGTCVYLVGTVVALYLFYNASKGVADNHPDLMRRVVLALFTLFQFDKMPAFVAFLMIYSPETGTIYPSVAALALSAYIPVSYFLVKLSWQSERVT